MLARDINPFIRRAFVMTRTPYNKLVKCADCRLFYIISGNGRVTVDGNEIPFTKDSLFLWRSGTEYQWNFSKKEKPAIAIINFDYTQNFRNKVKWVRLIPQSAFKQSKIFTTDNFDDITVLNTPVILDNMRFYKKNILDIIDEFSENKLYSAELAENMLCNLILCITRHMASSITRAQTKIEPILEYIKQNYDKEITNISLGKMVNYHPHYINLLMKEYTGTTLHSYLTDYRMNKAVSLIMNTTLSIESIALKIGFKNSSHFCKMFKQKFGVSPSSYRKSAKLI